MRIRRIVTVTTLTALTAVSVAACGTQALKSYAQGTWNCIQVEEDYGNTETVTYVVGDGTWEVTESTLDYYPDSAPGAHGTWAFGPAGATITNSDGDEYSGGVGYPETAEDGSRTTVWEGDQLAVTIEGKKVTLDYENYAARWVTHCTKA